MSQFVVFLGQLSTLKKEFISRENVSRQNEIYSGGKLSLCQPLGQRRRAKIAGVPVSSQPLRGFCSTFLSLRSWR